MIRCGPFPIQMNTQRSLALVSTTLLVVAAIGLYRLQGRAVHTDSASQAGSNPPAATIGTIPAVTSGDSLPGSTGEHGPEIDKTRPASAHLRAYFPIQGAGPLPS